jgi:hypothetical protein
MRRERSLRKNLRQILLSKFHHNIYKGRALHLAVSGFKDANQMRMGKPGRGAKAGDGVLRIGRLHRNKFNDSFCRPRPVGQKNRAVV